MKEQEETSAVSAAAGVCGSRHFLYSSPDRDLIESFPQRENNFFGSKSQAEKQEEIYRVSFVPTKIWRAPQVVLLNEEIKIICYHTYKMHKQQP